MVFAEGAFAWLPGLANDHTIGPFRVAMGLPWVWVGAMSGRFYAQIGSCRVFVLLICFFFSGFFLFLSPHIRDERFFRHDLQSGNRASLEFALIKSLQAAVSSSVSFSQSFGDVLPCSAHRCPF